MFGFMSRQGQDMPNPNGGLLGRSAPMSRQEKMGLLGAMLQDMGTQGQAGALAGFQQRQLTAQERALKNQAMHELLESLGDVAPHAQGEVAPGQDPASPQAASPSRGVPTIRDMAPSLARAALLGLPIDGFVDVLDKAGPQIDVVNGVAYDKRATAPGTRIGVNLANVNGALVDPNDPKNVDRYVPKLPDGAEPLYDRNGKLSGVKMIDGVVQAIGAAAGAEAGARKAAEAPYTFQTVPMPDGSTQLASQDQLVRNLLPPGAGRSQSPSAARQSQAADAAALDLPKVTGQAQDMLSLIQSIKAHPALKSRTGLMALAPAIPGTPGADFDVMAGQLQGKAFLQAFETLKGGGQITEREGEAATNAIARLKRTQTPEAYAKALDDLAAVIQSGVARSAQRATGVSAATGGYSRAQLEAEARRRGMMR